MKRLDLRKTSFGNSTIDGNRMFDSSETLSPLILKIKEGNLSLPLLSAGCASGALRAKEELIHSKSWIQQKQETTPILKS